MENNDTKAESTENENNKEVGDSSDVTDQFYGKPEGEEGKETSKEATTAEDATKEESSPESTEKGETKKADSEEAKKESSGEKSSLDDFKDSKLSKEELEDVLSQSEKLGLSKEQTEKFAKLREEAKTDFEGNVKTEFEKIQESWKEDLKKDPYLGGDNLVKTNELVTKFADSYVDSETRDWLKDSGMINHPGLVRAFARVGRELSDDQRVVGSPSTKADTAPKKAEDIFYGS